MKNSPPLSLQEATSLADKILVDLRAEASQEWRLGMTRFGVNIEKALGISNVTLGRLAKNYPKDNQLMRALWRLDVHEARLLACFVGRPAFVDGALMDEWTLDFDSWDICDKVCYSLFCTNDDAIDRAYAYAKREELYVKRTAFALMAGFAVHRKGEPDDFFTPFFALIEEAADDDRPMVKKAVNWALRQIGKRNHTLLPLALDVAKRLKTRESRSAKWIGADAARELSARL